MAQTPKEIVSTLLPTLIESARYARRVQGRIQALEEKQGAANLFAAALSDADLSVQTHVELALLAHYPNIPFFGEEWENSRNTKYLAGKTFLPNEDFLITLDPIDGTRLYLDGHRDYQIILTVISREAFEAVIVLFPCYNEYIFALRNQGAFHANFDTPISAALPWKIKEMPNQIYVSSELSAIIPKLKSKFSTIFCSNQYNKDVVIPYLNSLLRSQLCGAITSSAQIIDGAALAFVASEMGYIVQSHNGGGIPRPVDYPNLILPGLVVGKDIETLSALKNVISK